MLAGLAFAILGVEASQTDQIDLFITVLIPPLVLACLGAGATLIYYGWKRKHALLDGAFEFDGILTEQVTRVINPKTGQVSTNYQYRIGDANIIWPPGAQPIYKPVVNERIQVTAAQITRSNPIALFGGKSKFDEQPRDAVVLEFRDRIRIHYAVQKYGKNMFLIYHAQMILAGIVGAALLLGGVLYVVFTQEIYRQSTFIQISLIIGLTVGFCFVLLVIFFVLNRIAKPPASE